ncbi:MAG TPA: T9SS type A sorting domain-containing protein [Candidatus Sulfotelmatobacter sp.]|nr:T9SS type A sorting domain-containing protein [Candidatus Sulfotelmatobacter sp.]
MRASLQHRLHRSALLALVTLALHIGPARGAPAPARIPDGGSGFFVVREDNRTGGELAPLRLYPLETRSELAPDVIVQHYSNDGDLTPGWPATGVSVVTGPSDASAPVAISDGGGGVIVFWTDYRGGTPTPFAQRIGGNGARLWNAGGVSLAGSSRLRELQAVTSDDSGGAYAAISDRGDRESDTNRLRLVHLSAGGTAAPGWPADGVTLSSAVGVDQFLRLFADGSGGATVIWQHFEAGPPPAPVYAQRVSASGALLWTPSSGVQVPDDYPSIPFQYPRAYASDGAGGFFHFYSGGGDLFGQHMDGSGALAWGPGGALLLKGSANAYLTATTDAQGGAFVYWADTYPELLALRVASTGQLAAGWPSSGVVVASPIAAPDLASVRVAVDSLGASIWIWPVEGCSDYGCDPSGAMLRAVKLDPSGAIAPGWPAMGATLTDAHADPPSTQAFLDGAGGVVVTWTLNVLGHLETDLFMGHVDGYGSPAMGAGKPLFSQERCQRGPAIVADGSGGAYTLWQERRQDAWSIYSRQVSGAGGVSPQSLLLCAGGGSRGDIRACTDGSGGVIATWRDGRQSYDQLYSIRFHDSTLDWPFEGLRLDYSLAYTPQLGCALESDGGGGAYSLCGQPYAVLHWLDGVGPIWGLQIPGAPTPKAVQGSHSLARDGSGGVYAGVMNDGHLIVLHVFSNMMLDWSGNGVALGDSVCESPGPVLGFDGVDGVCVAWLEGDYWNPGAALRIARLDRDGAPPPGWSMIGFAADSTDGLKVPIEIGSDGARGIVLGWIRSTANGGWKAYAQRWDSTGTAMWGQNGIPISTAPGSQILTHLIASASGGVIATWMDARNSSWDIYAQRLANDGSRLWSAGGAAICTAQGPQREPVIASDEADGAIVAWSDLRDLTADQIYVAHVRSDGVLDWTSDGITPALASLVSASISDGVARLVWQLAPGERAAIERNAGSGWMDRASVVADGSGRATFLDSGLVPGTRIGWRVRVGDGPGSTSAGETWLMVPPGAQFALRGVLPNPSAGDLVVSFSLPAQARTTLDVLDVQGRRVLSRDLGSLEAGEHRVRLESSLGPGLYFARLIQGARRATVRFARIE